MNINFTGHHVDLTDPLRDYASKKLEKLSHFYDKITRVDITFDVNKNQLQQKVAASLHIPHNSMLHAESISEDMYASIDALFEKLKRQLEKLKEK